MAVKEKTHAPGSARSESTKAPRVVTPALIPARANNLVKKKPAEVGEAATSIQRARASASMQQRMGNARAEQMMSAAPPLKLQTTITLTPVSPKPPATAPKVVVPPIKSKPTLEKGTKEKASPERGLTTAPEKEAGTASALAKVPTPSPKVGTSETTTLPEEKSVTDKPKTAETAGKEEKPSAESGETKAAEQPKQGAAAKAEDKEKKASVEGKQEAAGKPEKEEAKAEAPPSPREAIAPAISAVRNRAAGARRHSAPGTAVGSAQAAAINPATEQTRAAATQTVKNLDATEAEKVKRNEFKTKLMQAIEAATPKPKTKDEAENVMKTGAAQASGALRGEMSAQSEQAAGPLQSAATTEVEPSSLPAEPKTDLVPEPIGEPPAEVSAAPVVPAPLPAERLDYSSDRGPTDNAMAENNVTSEQLQKGNEPEFGQALGARTEAQEHETKAEATYRQSEAKVQDDARNSAEKKLANELGGIHGARAAQIGKVVGQQTQTVDKNAQERQRITETIDGIKNKTRADVTAILDTMEKEAGDIFEAGLTRAEQAYEDTFDEAKGGIGTWLTTWGDDWEELIENSLAKARAEYLRLVGVAIDDVSNLVDGKLQAAKQRVADGRTEVENFVKTLDDSVKKFGEEALQSVSADFDAMGTEIDERRDGLINKLAEQYKASYERMSAKETELREANKSLWQRVYDATVGLIKKIIEFKNMLMGVLAKAADVIGLIISDPIGFLGNLIDGVQKGIENFSNRIEEHLKKGLIEWLFGELAAGGIQIPETFDLKGILSLVMQVLGLTYANIRARAVTIVGEPVVKAIEQAAEIFQILLTEGPAGLWKYIKEQIGDFKEMILEQIKSFIIEKVIKAGIMWLIGLLNPVSAFFKACKAIYDIVMFFVERATQIMAFVNAVIDSMAAIARGAIDVAAKAVENALAKAIPVVIGFLAALLGLGGISEKIKEIIDAIRAPINKAIDWVINLAVKGVKAVGKLLGVGKDKDPDKEKEMKDKGGIEDGLGETVTFPVDGTSHSLWIVESGNGIEVMVKSDPKSVRDLLAEFESKLEGKDSADAKKATNLISKAYTKLSDAEKEATEEQQADQHAETKPEDAAATQEANTAKKETVEKEQTLGEVLAQIFKLVHGGESVLGLLDRHIINRDTNGDSIRDQAAVAEMKKASYTVYAQERLEKQKYYVRRDGVPEDESEKPQVHFTEKSETDEGGKLELGPSTAKADDTEKFTVYNMLLDLVGLSHLTEKDVDEYRREARKQIIAELVKQGREGLLEFMDKSTAIPPVYNRLRGDIYDDWLTQSGTRSYKKAPVFLQKDYPEMSQDRQPDGARGKRLYDAKGHGGLGPNADEMQQYRDYLVIISDPKSGYTGLVYVIMNHDSRKKWESKCPEAMFAP